MGRDHIRKHPEDWTRADWEHAREYLALAKLESDEIERAKAGI